MTLDERILQKADEVSSLHSQLQAIDSNMASLQQARERVILALQRSDGALEVLNQIKAEEAAAQGETPPAPPEGS